MGAKKKLGILRRVEDLRGHWPDEARDFTPWLAEDDQLDSLGAELGIELELVGTEQSVGSYKVDILAKDSESDRNIVIENQLENTNHNHLGQILTYASGLSATSVIWIAKEFKDEHKRAFEWLNEISDDEVNFFAITIELWRVGDSDPAPKFNIVCSPNDWARNVKSSGSDSSSRSKVLTNTKLLQKEFWEYLTYFLMEAGSPIKLHKAHAKHWLNFAIGKSGTYVSLTINSVKKEIACSLIIRNGRWPNGYDELLKHKNDIDSVIDEAEWRETPNKGRSKVVVSEEIDFTDKENWDSICEWFKFNGETFQETFSPLVKRFTGKKAA